MENLLGCMQVGVSDETEGGKQNPSLPVPLTPLRRWLSLGLGLEKNLFEESCGAPLGEPA